MIKTIDVKIAVQAFCSIDSNIDKHEMFLESLANLPEFENEEEREKFVNRMLKLYSCFSRFKVNGYERDPINKIIIDLEYIE